MLQSALIDLDHLDRYVGGDRLLRDEILGIFEEQAASCARLLDPAADDVVWRDMAHALKGASRGVGAWTVGDICADAEMLVGAQRDEAVRRATLQRLETEVRVVIDEVRRLRAL